MLTVPLLHRSSTHYSEIDNEGIGKSAASLAKASKDGASYQATLAKSTDNFVRPIMPPYRLIKLRRQWDELAKVDPLFAIVSGRNLQFGKWDLEEFFRSGERDVGHLIARANTPGYPLAWGKALEGCGLSRRTGREGFRVRTHRQ